MKDYKAEILARIKECPTISYWWFMNARRARAMKQLERAGVIVCTLAWYPRWEFTIVKWSVKK